MKKKSELRRGRESFEEMGKWSVNMEVGGDAVAVITIDNAPVNSLAIPGEFFLPFYFFSFFLSVHVFGLSYAWVRMGE